MSIYRTEVHTVNQKKNDEIFDKLDFLKKLVDVYKEIKP